MYIWGVWFLWALFALGAWLNIFCRLVFPTSEKALHPGPVYRRWVGLNKVLPRSLWQISVQDRQEFAIALPHTVQWPWFAQHALAVPVRTPVVARRPKVGGAASTVFVGRLVTPVDKG